MKHFIKITLLLVLITYPEWVVAGNSNSTHTHTNTPIELGFVSANIGTQYAAVCFLGGDNCGDADFGTGDEDMTVNTGDQCKNEGFDKTCQPGWHPEIGIKCPHDPNYIKCCKETCPENAATSCTGEAVGSDGCGYTCKKCCSTSCDARYNYTASQLTGSTGNGWVKDGEDFCDHCTKGKLYKRKAAQLPSGYKTCGCGGSNPFVSGGTTYYQNCNCCSSCSGSTSTAGMPYYNSCYNSCTGQTLYSPRSCSNYCSGSTKPSSCPGTIKTEADECGNICYSCEVCTNYPQTLKNCAISGICYYITNNKWYQRECACVVSSQVASAGGYTRIMGKIIKYTKEECESTPTDSLKCSSYENQIIGYYPLCHNV